MLNSIQVDCLIDDIKPNRGYESSSGTTSGYIFITLHNKYHKPDNSSQAKKYFIQIYDFIIAQKIKSDN